MLISNGVRVGLKRLEREVGETVDFGGKFVERKENSLFFSIFLC